MIGTSFQYRQQPDPAARRGRLVDRASDTADRRGSTSAARRTPDQAKATSQPARPRLSERNPDQITGYAVSLDGVTNGADEPVRFGGGKLAPDLSLPKLRARWEPASPESTTADHQTAPDPAAARPRGPLTAAEAERVWRGGRAHRPRSRRPDLR